MLSDWCVTRRQASFLPTPNHLSASMMALYPQKERNRDGKILCVREVPSYTHKKKAGKYTVHAVYAKTQSAVVLIHLAFDYIFISIPNLQREGEPEGERR